MSLDTSHRSIGRIAWIAALILSLGVTALSRSAVAETAPEPSSPEFGTYLMNRIDDMHRGVKSQGVMEMKVQTKHWTRSMTLESWSLGKDYSLIRIVQPIKEKGTATLKAKDSLFTYLNKTGQTIKLTGGMMGGSWMGSHFTNDDLVHNTRLADAFDIKRNPDEVEAGMPVYRFSLLPKHNTAVVWGRIDVSVRRSDLAPLSETFFDEDGKKMRSLEFSEWKEIGGRERPMKMVMRPLDGSNEFTEIEWKELRFDVDLDESFFTVLRLKSQ